MKVILKNLLSFSVFNDENFVWILGVCSSDAVKHKPLLSLYGESKRAGKTTRDRECVEGEEEENRGEEKGKEVTVVPFSRLSEVSSKNWKQWRSLISHHLHRVYSASDKPPCNPELPHTHTHSGTQI